MFRNPRKPPRICRALLISAVACNLLLPMLAGAQQVDIPGPSGSSAFGTAVAVLPNGNIVVTDPNALSNKGAAYLYSLTGNLISSLTGATANDHVGSGGITVLANGNYVISSPQWANGSESQAGAVTWINGSTGLSGVVSPTNSLIGETAGDFVGDPGMTSVGGSGITALTNGNYVVASPNWSNPSGNSQVGSVTWANGNTGLSGVISVSNSLVGTQYQDQVGLGIYTTSVFALSNGNYVVVSPSWINGSFFNAGAVTWANGSTGLSGAVSITNSLVGSTTNDFVGNYGVTALSNGNYVVLSPSWHNGAAVRVGAATWASGNGGQSGTISVANSLVGSQNGDNVGETAVALSNGNYVVDSFLWHNGGVTAAGAVTWANGNTGLSGTVSVANSLVGSSLGDNVGNIGITALSNGNYVVSSYLWHNGSGNGVGAATWGNGTTGISGVVSAANSLVGSKDLDDVSFDGIIVLKNGNYVVASSSWDNGGVIDAGAVTWANGSTGLSGMVSTSNSLVGNTNHEYVGFGPVGFAGGVVALSNGNYVVATPGFDNGAATNVGAVTWVNGSTGQVGVVSAVNSLVGTAAFDDVGSDGVTALSNGNYVVASSKWHNGGTANAGAVTWLNGTAGFAGIVSAANSLVGTMTNDYVGLGQQGQFDPLNAITVLNSGNYLVTSPNWNNGAATAAGAVSQGRNSGGLVGTVRAANSVRGTNANGGASLVSAYDATRDQLVVGRPKSNIVSLFKLDLLLTGGFE